MKRSDESFRAQLPGSVRELLTAYEDATNRRITLDHIRARALSDLALREVTYDDVLMVVRYVKRLAKLPKITRPDGTTMGFSDASIGFQNLMLDVNKFEDRLLEAREDILKRATRGRGKKPLLLQVEAGEMKTLVEVEPQTSEAVAMKRVAREALLALARGLE